MDLLNEMVLEAVVDMPATVLDDLMLLEAGLDMPAIVVENVMAVDDVLPDLPTTYSTRAEALDDTINRELLRDKKVKQSTDNRGSTHLSIECSDVFCLWKVGFRVKTKNGIRAFHPKGDNFSTHCAACNSSTQPPSPIYCTSTFMMKLNSQQEDKYKDHLVECSDEQTNGLGPGLVGVVFVKTRT